MADQMYPTTGHSTGQLSKMNAKPKAAITENEWRNTRTTNKGEEHNRCGETDDESPEAESSERRAPPNHAAEDGGEKAPHSFGTYLRPDRPILPMSSLPSGL
jgi:hypothetical protein